MKIAILANDTTYTYNLRKELIKDLALRGNEIVVVGSAVEFVDKLSELGCRVINVPTGRHSKNPIHDLRLLLRYISILRDETPNVVLTFNIKPNVYGGIACSHLGIRYLANVTGLGTALEYSGFLQSITAKLYQIGVANAETVFFQNVANQFFFIERHMLSPTSSSVILPGSGVDLSQFQPAPYPTEEDVNFLFVSRILKEKGIDLYLGAAREITQRYKNITFHICGQCDDDRYQRVINDASKKGYVKYHGMQKDIKPFYETANCIIHPSYYPEGMSNVCLEAAACARPVITTDRSGCAETVDDGKSGFIIPIRDEKALVQAIERFLALSHEEQMMMGLEGRHKVVREFDRNLVVQSYLRTIYKDEKIEPEREYAISAGEQNGL